jgi:Plant transposon protein
MSNATTELANTLNNKLSKHISTRFVIDTVAMDPDDDDDIHILQEEMDFDDLLMAAIFDSSSDEEGTARRTLKTPNKQRDFKAANDLLVAHYFSGRESLYNEADFERRFRMPRSVFQRIHDASMGTDPFIHKEDATKKLGLYPLVKLVACLRHLAYGDAYDREDENLQISETALAQLTKQFCRLVVERFGQQYLNRPPTLEERKVISARMSRVGFPGCLGSWDCKHFNWKNCPMRLAGQHKGHAEGGKTTLILEAFADYRRYFWYVNFDDPGSLNDLNVLDKSSIVYALLNGTLSIVTTPYTINDKERDWMYFLVDGIYPPWGIFVTTFSKPKEDKKKKFQQQQERVRKDIECAFGILIARFHVLERPLRNWYLEDIKSLLHCCVILHNMIIEERSGNVSEYEVQAAANVSNMPFPLFGRHQVTAEEAAADGIELWAARVSGFGTAMESSYEHELLKNDLVEHISSLNLN